MHHPATRVALYDELSQRLNRLQLVVYSDGLNIFSDRGKNTVIDDASRVGPFWIEWATSKGGFGRLFLIVSNLPRSKRGVHINI